MKNKRLSGQFTTKVQRRGFRIQENKSHRRIILSVSAHTGVRRGAVEVCLALVRAQHAVPLPDTKLNPESRILNPPPCLYGY